MTGIRASVVWRKEDKFGVPGTGAWNLLGSGVDATFTPKNNMTELKSIGTKFRVNETYGKFSGTFSLNFILDYGNLNALELGFDRKDASGG
jgi:hypothetical protein